MDHSTLVLDSVLTDVGLFIGSVLSGEKLSVEAAEKREKVLKRLRVYLPAPNLQYLDMNAGSKTGSSPGLQPAVKNEYVGADHQVWVEEEYEECPDVEVFKIEQQPLEVTSSIITASNATQNTVKIEPSAHELKKVCAKSGPLSRKERKFFIDQLWGCWAAVHEGHLYFYANERSSKPTFVTDLQGYKARAIPALTKKKRDARFEVVCPGKKSFQLVARTDKDMQQWVANICQESTPICQTRRQLPSIPGSHCSDSYDDIDVVISREHSQQAGLMETEDFYDDIKVGDHSDDESIYDDIGEGYLGSDFNNELLHKAKEELNSTLNEKEEVQSLTKQETAEDEEIYDDVNVVMNRELTSRENSNKPQTEIANKEITHNVLPKKVFRPKNVVKKEIPSEGNSNKETASKDSTIKEIASKLSKPHTFPKPSFKDTIHQGAPKPGHKNNIQNLIQQMESSLQMK